MAKAEVAAERASTAERPLGTPGRPWNRRSPFLMGLTGAAGVAVTYGIVKLILDAGDVLTLIGLALFLAVGLEPAVSWLVLHRVPRWAAVLSVIVAGLAVVGGFLAVAIPIAVVQAEQLAHQIPGYLRMLQDRHSVIGRLNAQFGIEQRVVSLLNGQGSSLVQGILGAGQVVVGAVTGFFVVVMLTIYFLADMPRIRRALYRLVPGSRRPRAILIGDEIVVKVGGYVLGNLLTSAVAGIATFVWLLAWGVPYPLLLALLVALLDLVPVVGSIIGGVVIALVAWTVGLPVMLATVGFMLAYRAVEDYLLVPKIIGRTVRVPAVVTVVAVLVGGTLLGVIGALVAIPLAAVGLLLLREVAFPRLDRA